MKKILGFMLGIALLSACCGTTNSNNSNSDSTTVDSLDTVVTDTITTIS